MAFNKIQPEQREPRITFCSSGDILVNSTDTGLSLEISRNLTGNFDVSGKITVDGDPILKLPSTGDGVNVYKPESGTLVLNGVNNDISGTDNIIINGFGNIIQGTGQVSINGFAQTIETGTSHCTTLGRGSWIPSETTGAVVFTDSTSPIVYSKGSDSCVLDFNQGVHLTNGTYCYNDINIHADGSGIFSGNLENNKSFFLLSEKFIFNIPISGFFDFTTFPPVTSPNN